MKKLLLPIVYYIVLFGVLSCTQEGVSSNANYQNALESLFDGNIGLAIDFLDTQLIEDPDHIDARFVRSQMYCHLEDYRRALIDVNYAIENYSQKAEVTKSSLFALKGAIYYAQYRYKSAQEPYKKAVDLALKDNPDKVQDYKFILAQALYFSDDFDGAEGVYLSMLNDDPEDYTALVGLARNLRDQEKYEEALELLEEAESCDPNYPSVYKFKMQIYGMMDKVYEAIDAALTYYELDDDSPLGLIEEYVVKDIDYAIKEAKTRMEASDDSVIWESLISYLIQKRGVQGITIQI